MNAATVLDEARHLLAARLRAAGLQIAEREASLLLAAAMNLRAIDLIAHPDTPLGPAAARVEAFAGRREAGEPLSRIVGRREFWSLDFRITPYVLDPRADTETLVEAAIGELAERRREPLRIVDFGVGSGAILAALLAEFPNATGLGVDFSETAAETARVNLAALGFASRAGVQVADWGESLEDSFDLIVSNPPYIASAEIATLDRDVRDHDPRLALDGGADGLNAYRALAPQIARLIEPRAGRVFLEHGAGQGAAVSAILNQTGIQVTGVRADLSGVDRVVIGRPC